MTTARNRPALRLAVASGVELASAIDAFLSQPDLAATTRAKDRQTLAVVEDELGDAPVTGPGLAGIVAQRWHHASPATWNRHVSTIRSFAHSSASAPGSWTSTLDAAVDLLLALAVVAGRRDEPHEHGRAGTDNTRAAQAIHGS